MNTRSREGWTPLHEACRHQHGEIVQVLISNAASVNIVDGNSPLHALCEFWRKIHYS